MVAIDPSMLRQIFLEIAAGAAQREHYALHWSVSAPVREGRAKSAAKRTQSEPVQKNTSFETARNEIP